MVKFPETVRQAQTTEFLGKWKCEACAESNQKCWIQENDDGCILCLSNGIECKFVRTVVRARSSYTWAELTGPTAASSDPSIESLSPSEPNRGNNGLQALGQRDPASRSISQEPDNASRKSSTLQTSLPVLSPFFVPSPPRPPLPPPTLRSWAEEARPLDDPLRFYPISVKYSTRTTPLPSTVLPALRGSEDIVSRSSIRTSSPSSAASIPGSIPTDSLLDSDSSPRRRLKRRSLDVFVHESGTEAHRGNGTRKGSRRSALSPDARERARKVRSIGACWRCKVQKKTCTGDTPCERCASYVKYDRPTPCLRGPLTDLADAVIPELAPIKLYMRAALHQESLTSMARDFLTHIGNLREVGHEVVQKTLRLLNMTSGENLSRSLRDVLSSFEYLRSKSDPQTWASRLFVVCLLIVLGRYWFDNDLVRLVYYKQPKISLVLRDSINQMQAVMDILMLLVQGEPRYYITMIRGVADGAIDRTDRLPMSDTLDVHSKTSPYQPVRDIFFTHSLDLPPVQSTRKQRGSTPPDTVMSDPDNRASATDSQSGASTDPPHPGEQRKYVCMLYGPWLIDSTDRPYCSFCGMRDASEEHLVQEHQAFECFKQPADDRTYLREEELSEHMICFHDVDEDSLVTMTEHDGPVKVDTMVGRLWARGRRGARREEEEGDGDKGD